MGNNTYYVKSTEEKRAHPQLLVQGEPMDFAGSRFK